MSTIKDYENIINNLNFIEKLSIRKNFEKGYYIVRGDINGRDVLLKIIPNKDKDRVDKFTRELTVDKIIDKHNEYIDRPLINVTEILTSGKNKDYFWVIRKYYPGTSLARLEGTRSFLGYDRIRPKFIISRKKIVSQIVESISALQELTNDFRKLGVKKRSFQSRYNNDIEKNSLNQLEKKLSVDLTNHRDIFNRISDKYLSREQLVATHADLSPANIIVRNDGKLFLSDFERFCFDNYTLDFAYLWLFLYRYSKWQKELVKLSLHNDQDRELFLASIIRILTQQIYWPADSAGLSKDLVKRIDYTKKHKWFKYLKASGESFEALMKVH